MAQGDIIETMLGWIVELFGWIFKMLSNYAFGQFPEFSIY